MHPHLAALFQTVFQKSVPILLNFLDDALILGLTRLGISLPWLQWLSLLLLGFTLLSWSVQIARFFYHRYQVNQA